MGHQIGSTVMVGILSPLIVAGMSSLVMLVFFLFFPEVVFKLWLRRIAWWYAIGLTIAVLTTPVDSSHILSVSPSEIVLGGAVILAIITVPFAFIMRKRTE